MKIEISIFHQALVPLSLLYQCIYPKFFSFIPPLCLIVASPALQPFGFSPPDNNVGWKIPEDFRNGLCFFSLLVLFFFCFHSPWLNTARSAIASTTLWAPAMRSTRRSLLSTGRNRMKAWTTWRGKSTVFSVRSLRSPRFDWRIPIHSLMVAAFICELDGSSWREFRPEPHRCDFSSH